MKRVKLLADIEGIGGTGDIISLPSESADRLITDEKAERINKR